MKPGGFGFKAGEDHADIPQDVGEIDLYVLVANENAPNVNTATVFIQDSAGRRVSLVGVPDANERSTSVQLIAGQATVAFITPILAADYRIKLQSYGDDLPKPVNKTSTGFGIVSSDSTSTSVVDVFISRQPAP